MPRDHKDKSHHHDKQHNHGHNHGQNHGHNHEHRPGHGTHWQGHESEHHFIRWQISNLNSQIQREQDSYNQRRTLITSKQNRMTELKNAIRDESENGIYEYNIQVNDYRHRNDFTTNILLDSLLQAMHLETDRQMYYQKQRDHQAAINLNSQLTTDLSRLDQGIATCESYLSDLKNENARIRNFKAHQQLLANPELALGGLTQLPPLSQPIERFKQNNKYTGCPYSDGYSLPAIALLNNNQQLFVMAINTKGYALNDRVIAAEINPLEQLRKHPDAVTLLKSIASKVTQNCIDYLVEKSVSDLESTGLNLSYITLQLSLLTWLLKTMTVSDTLQNRLKNLAMQYAQTHFEFSEAFFSNKVGNFYELESEQRVPFLRALTSANKPANEILRWYTTGNTCKINELYSDFKTCGFTPPLAMIARAIDDKLSFNPAPEDGILETLMAERLKGAFPSFETFANNQPSIIKNWFSNESTYHVTKMKLICLLPKLFSTKQCQNTFINEAVGLDSVLYHDYKALSEQLKNTDITVSAPVLFAFAKTRIEKATTAEQIRLFALELEHDWKEKGVPVDFTEVMMKVAKNCALTILRDNPNQGSDTMLDFMGKHRKRHYLYFKCLPLPHLFAPSKAIYKQYQDKKNTAGDTAFKKEKQREDVDVDRIINNPKPC